MSVLVPSGLLNIKGAIDPVAVNQANAEAINRSLAFMRVPSSIDGVETTKYGTPWDSGIWPEGTTWVDAGFAAWRCKQYPGDAPEKWEQLDFCVTRSYPAPVPDGYLIRRVDLDNRIFRYDLATTTWVELYLSIQGATWTGTEWRGSMKGPTILYRDPIDDMEAVTRRWVEDRLNPLAIESFSALGFDGTYASTIMLGKQITSVKFDWAYSRPSVVFQQITSDSPHSVGSVTPTSLRTKTVTFGTAVTETKTWALEASDSSGNVTAYGTIKFYPPVYAGVNAASSASDELLSGLPTWLQPNPYLSTSVVPGAKYIWIAYPSTWAAPQIFVNGLHVTGWESSVLFHTNLAGYSQGYQCYRSQHLLNGTDPISVQIA